MSSLKVVVVFKEVDDLVSTHVTTGISINSLEDRVRSKIPDETETLTSSFEAVLTIAYCNEQVLKSMF
jgi:hypothetical protein